MKATTWPPFNYDCNWGKCLKRVFYAFVRVVKAFLTQFSCLSTKSMFQYERSPRVIELFVIAYAKSFSAFLHRNDLIVNLFLISNPISGIFAMKATLTRCSNIPLSAIVLELPHFFPFNTFSAIVPVYYAAISFFSALTPVFILSCFFCDCTEQFFKLLFCDRTAFSSIVHFFSAAEHLSPCSSPKWFFNNGPAKEPTDGTFIK